MSLRRRRPPQWLTLESNKAIGETVGITITRTAGAPTAAWRVMDGGAVYEYAGDALSHVVVSGLCKIECRLSPKMIATLTANTQSITRVSNLWRATALTLASLYDLVGAPAILFPESIQSITATGATPGSIPLSKLKNANYIEIYGAASGSLSDLPSTCQYAYINSAHISLGAIHQCAGIVLFYAPTSGFFTSDIDAIILDIWQNRSSFTYAGGITCRLDGNNAAPSGNVTEPEEGSDWHLDGETWIPLTAGAMVFDLVNDVNSEGFNFWDITVT